MEYYRESARPRDLRVVKTIDAIQSTFKEMLMEGSFEDVTVKELCERARVNKKTFYRYYPAIEYLLAEMQQGYSEKYLKTIEGLSFPGNAGEITRRFLEFSLTQDELYEKITCESTHARIREQMIAMVEESSGGGVALAAPDGWPAGEWEVYLAFVSNVPLEMYRAWVAGGKAMAEGELVDTAVAAVEAGSSAFIRIGSTNR